MQTASAAHPAPNPVNEIRLANLSPSVRNRFLKTLQTSCCPELKAQDVEAAMKASLNTSNFSIKEFGDGFVAFRAAMPTGEVLVTSRMQLQQLIT